MLKIAALLLGVGLLSGCTGLPGRGPAPAGAEASPGAEARPADPGGVGQALLWEVDDRFQLFDQPGDPSGPARSAELLRRYSQDKQGTRLADYRALADLGAPLAEGRGIRRNPWDPDKQRYDPDYLKGRDRHRIRLALREPVPGDCTWGIGSGEPRTAPCGSVVVWDGVPNRFKAWVTDQQGQRLAEVSGKVERRVVLALGDSYASGEGNPDVPSRWKSGARPSAREKGSLDEALAEPPLWWDTRCHRSSWSNQFLAAMQVAYREPHAYTTLINYACSGAEVFDGLLRAQKDPPGAHHGCKDLDTPLGVPGSRCPGDVDLSQVSAAARDLCLANDGHKVSTRVIKPETGAPWPRGQGPFAGSVCTEPARVDVLLLSIGGNDIGFAGVVGWALAPVSPWRDEVRKKMFKWARRTALVCPTDDMVRRQGKYGSCQRESAQARIRGLPARYDALETALRVQLGTALASATRQLMTAYPSPLIDPRTGKVCDQDTFQRAWRARGERSPQASWDALAYIANKTVANSGTRWDFNLSPDEAREVQNGTIAPLQETMKEEAPKHGWTLVTDQLPRYLEHGWCATSADAACDDDFTMPGIPRKGSDPNRTPADWDPYRCRGRWLRTINDAMQTQWTPGLGIGGSVHPTAEGHYATQEAMVAVLYPPPPPVAAPSEASPAGAPAEVPAAEAPAASAP